MQFAAFEDRGILLLIDFSAEINLDFQPFGKRIDNAGPDAMQAARKGIALIIELSARVQLRKDNLYARDMQLWVNADGNAAAVIFDGNAQILI